MEFVNKIGVDTIRKHNLALTEKMIKNLDKKELISPNDANHRSGTMIIHFGNEHGRMIKLLTDNLIDFDSRSKGIRISPHLYNTEKQIEALSFLINDNR